MEAVARLHAGDVFAWFLNVSTSVIIVFANKVLLDSKNGHAFAFGRCCALVDATQQQPQHSSLTVAVVPAATTLCGLHFLACAASIWVVQALGLAQRAPLPRAGDPSQLPVQYWCITCPDSTTACCLALLITASQQGCCHPAASTCLFLCIAVQ
jgi:hypothetical protein